MTKTAILAVVLFAAAVPARAQSRVYTNADLGRPLTPDRPTVSAETLRALAARQFVAPLEYPRQASVTIPSNASEGPWDWPDGAADEMQPVGQPLWLGAYGGGRRRIQSASRMSSRRSAASQPASRRRR